MSSTTDYLKAISRAVAFGDLRSASIYCMQAADKVNPAAGAQIREYFNKPLPDLKHWEKPRKGPVAFLPNGIVCDVPVPYMPDVVEHKVNTWMRELVYAEALVSAGERIQPLLFVGETRCGKTSQAGVIAAQMNLELYRLNLADAVGSHIGDTALKMKAALQEARSRPGVWLIDEIDAVAMQRRGGQAAEQERAHAIGTLLTLMDELPPDLILVATTNHVDTIDGAVLGRMRVVNWPTWGELRDKEREDFLRFHGYEGTVTAASYSSAVALARQYRVAKVMAMARERT